MRRTVLLLLMLFMISPVCLAGDIVASETYSGELLSLELDKHISGVSYEYIPEANAVYRACAFADQGVDYAISIYLNGAFQGGSTNAPLDLRLISGRTYTVTIKGDGRVRFEISRLSLGRTFDMPIELDRGFTNYTKLIARSGDVHWYAFSALFNSPATVITRPLADSELKLDTMLFSAGAEFIEESAEFADGSSAIYGELKSGERYMLRVSSPGGETGAYTLAVAQDAVNVEKPAAITLMQDEIQLVNGETFALSYELSPADAHPAVLFETSDKSVASVSPAGEIKANSDGSCYISAIAYGNVQARVKVDVPYVALSGIAFDDAGQSLRVGETAYPFLVFYPENASDKQVNLYIHDEDIAVINDEGYIEGVSEGETYAVAVSADGNFTDMLEIHVLPAAPEYRALVVAQQMYLSSVNKVRVGSINTAQSIANLLELMSYDGGEYTTEILLDTTRKETLQGIRSAFAGAKHSDVSLLYVNCHGYYKNGMAVLQFYDGSTLTAPELERELRKVKGKVILIVDCCGSGGFIGEASELADFNAGIISVFAGVNGGSAFNTSKYKVLASAALEQDSYRLSFDSDYTESTMATVFARSICDGAGYDITRAASAPVRADADYNGKITLNEMYMYTSRRVMWYLKLVERRNDQAVTYVQNVQVYPMGDPFVLFSR